MKKCCWNCRNLYYEGGNYYCWYKDTRTFLLYARKMPVKEAMEKLSNRGIECPFYKPVHPLEEKKSVNR